MTELSFLIFGAMIAVLICKATMGQGNSVPPDTVPVGPTRIITLGENHTHLNVLEKMVLEKRGSVTIYCRYDTSEETPAFVSLKLHDGPETREIEFNTETVEQAAKLIVERLAKP